MQELFWPNAARPAASLRMALSQLRKGAVGTFESDDLMVRSTVDSDVGKLLAFLQSTQLEQAAELYQHAFLENFTLLDWSTELEEWVYSSREYIASQVRSALLRLAEEAAKQSDFKKAAKLAEKAYKLPGVNEPEVTQLEFIYTLLLAGKSFLTRTVDSHLKDYEVDLELSQHTARAKFTGQEAKNNRNDHNHNLPPTKTSFVGRDLELIELANLLGQADGRLVTLLGPGGIGKTRLATQLAYGQLQEGRFSDGIYFVPLDALNHSRHIPTTIASILNISLQGQDTTLNEVAQAIRDQELLLILDNYEHLIEGATLVANLLDACQGLKIVVTSRERLNIEAEFVLPLQGLPTPTQTDLSLIEAETLDVFRLFLQRAKRARLDFSVTEEALPHILKICQLVDGSPLGIELAAVWIRMMTPAEIVQEISLNLDILNTPSRDITQRHQSMRAVFEHSWNLLNTKEQQVLSKLTVFRGGFMRDAASAVADATIPILASLIDKSLLQVDLLGRYQRHALLYQYSQEKLAAQPESEAASQEKHGSYFFEFLAQQDKEMWGASATEAMAGIDKELENIRTAWSWACKQKKSNLLKQPQGLVVYFDRQARFEEGVALFSEAIEALNEKNNRHHSGLAKVLVDKAWLLGRMGNLQEAQACAEQAVRLVRPLEKQEKLTLMKALNCLCTIAKNQAKFPVAKGYADEALRLARDYGDITRIATYLKNVATLERELDNLSDAEQHYLEALDIHRKQNSYFDVTIDLLELGLLMQIGVQHERLLMSQIYLQESLKLSRSFKQSQVLPYVLNGLAFTLFHLQKLDEARAHCLEGLELVNESSDLKIEGNLFATLGRIEIALDRPTEAQQHLRKGLQIIWPLNQTPRTLETLIYYAELLAEQGQTEKACRWLEIILNHPALETWGKYEAKQLLNELRMSASEVRPPSPFTNQCQSVEDMVEDVFISVSIP